MTVLGWDNVESRYPIVTLVKLRRGGIKRSRAKSLQSDAHGRTCGDRFTLSVSGELNLASYLSANLGYYAVLPLNVVNNSRTIAMVLPDFSICDRPGFWKCSFWTNRGHCSGPLRCSLMLWSCQLSYLLFRSINSLCRRGRIPSIIFWAVAYRALDSPASVAISWLSLLLLHSHR